MKLSRSLLLPVLAILPLLPVAAPAQAPAASPSADLSQYPTADALWQHIQDVKKGPATRPATAQEYHTYVTAMVSQLFAGATEFLRRYPNDPRKWDARLLQIETGRAIARESGPGGEVQAATQFQALASQADAPASIRGQASYELLGMALGQLMRGDKSVTPADILAKLKQFTTDFPTYPSLEVLKYRVAQSLAATDPASSESLLKELAASGTGPVASQARTELATKEKLKAPLDLHFTAVDGAPVDLARLRGKVVLIDFWATWCGPCRGELPNVLAAYKKLHDKGFDIVGISLDQDKDALVKYTAANNMTWPQFFDGQGWKNSISSGFGIQSIPAMWLVNKKGYVVTTNGRTDLEGQVEKLLAE